MPGGRQRSTGGLRLDAGDWVSGAGAGGRLRCAAGWEPAKGRRHLLQDPLRRSPRRVTSPSRSVSQQVQKVMPNDTFYFSILRNPVFQLGILLKSTTRPQSPPSGRSQPGSLLNLSTWTYHNQSLGLKGTPTPEQHVVRAWVAQAMAACVERGYVRARLLGDGPRFQLLLISGAFP